MIIAQTLKNGKIKIITYTTCFWYVLGKFNNPSATRGLHVTLHYLLWFSLWSLPHRDIDIYRRILLFRNNYYKNHNLCNVTWCPLVTLGLLDFRFCRGEYSTKCSDTISGHNYLVPGKNYFRHEALAVILPNKFFENDKNRLIRIFLP